MNSAPSVSLNQMLCVMKPLKPAKPLVGRLGGLEGDGVFRFLVLLARCLVVARAAGISCIADC